MKPSLTKEQAEWLIEQINIGIDECCNIGHNLKPPNSVYPCIIKIINLCTEQKFPAYVPNYAPVQITFAPENKSSFIALNILDDGFVNCVKYLDAKEFKQFTEGCNKIVKWLEENQ